MTPRLTKVRNFARNRAGRSAPGPDHQSAPGRPTGRPGDLVDRRDDRERGPALDEDEDEDRHQHRLDREDREDPDDECFIPEGRVSK
ncbi:hypothetical protein [Streptomyces sp. NPDC016626]|uniref:hypothetical protein n=1 Tax=Streptomyces sp. NPDC016626 TaxID=3364968 RepID=UPI00370045B7